MPYFRVRVHNGKSESVFEEEFRDEARLRDQLPKRGWTNILSVEQIEEPSAAAPPPETPPTPIRAAQIRDDGSWVHLPQELAEQHPLHGIGGWTGLLLAMMILGALGGLWALFLLGSLLAYGGLAFALFGMVLVLQLLNLASIVLLVSRSPAFPTVFIILAAISIRPRCSCSRSAITAQEISAASSAT
jgi:hypothetical protein